ncbi:MAG: hypothetical protein NTY23_12415, partial [Chloroflexi bacterium]|nr:hypothetical protein [Chloroflexota bacterium]
MGSGDKLAVESRSLLVVAALARDCLQSPAHLPRNDVLSGQPAGLEIASIEVNQAQRTPNAIGEIVSFGNCELVRRCIEQGGKLRIP